MTRSFQWQFLSMHMCQKKFQASVFFGLELMWKCSYFPLQCFGPYSISFRVLLWLSRRVPAGSPHTWMAQILFSEITVWGILRFIGDNSSNSDNKVVSVGLWHSEKCIHCLPAVSFVMTVYEKKVFWASVNHVTWLDHILLQSPALFPGAWCSPQITDWLHGNIILPVYIIKVCWLCKMTKLLKMCFFACISLSVHALFWQH